MPAALRRSQYLQHEFSTEPEAISCYSEVDGVIHYNSTTALRRFVVPPGLIHLNEGSSNEAAMCPIARRLDPVIEACLLSKAKHALLHADVITRRGVLTSLSCPDGKNAEFNFSFIDNKLFIEQNYTRDAIPTSLAGFGFEQNCTIPNSASYARGAYYSVISRRIGSLNFIYSGEVDCVTDTSGDGIPQPSKFMELKTRINTKKSWWIHLDNRKWYMQSYLLGTPNIFLGYRDKYDVLQKTEMIAVRDLQTTFQVGDASFDPQVALERIHDILRAVIHRMRLDLQKYRCDRAVWRMKVTPHGIKDLRRLASYEVHGLDSGDEERRIGIISERLISLMRRK